jgi:hypothetical protein
MRKLAIILAVLAVVFGIAAIAASAKGGPPVDEFGCTPSETYSGVFSGQLGVTGCVGNGTSVTFCHATSSESNPFVTLTTAIAAAVGQAGHFNENGTTAAGHEEDYVGACIETPDEDIVVSEVAPTMTEGSCEAAGVLTIPEQPEGIIVEVDGPLVGPAETTVTFTAAEGYVLTDGRTFAEYVFVLEGVQDCGGTTTEPPVDEPPVDEPPVKEPPTSEPPAVTPDAPAAPSVPTVADTL